jgi:uncharacterized membrane protein YozB (DUF420 family)
MSQDATGWPYKDPGLPAETAEGPRATTGRSAAILFGIIALMCAGLAIAAWASDIGKQAPCPPSQQQIFNIPLVTVGASAFLALMATLIVVVSLWRKPHRVAMVAALIVAFSCLFLILNAISFHHGQVSSCLSL